MKLLRVLKDVFVSSLPLAAVIVAVCGFVAPMGSTAEYLKLLLGYLCVVVGQTFFLVGLDVSILPIGKHVGESLVKLKKPIFIVAVAFVFGLLSTVAEPALSVLAKQTHMIFGVIDARLFIWVLSTGIGVFVGFALYRVIKDINIKIVFAVLYIAVFATAIFVPKEFIALSFDGSGATTGDVSVPFILALGVGVSAMMSRHKTNDDAFGIIGIASVGPVLALFAYGIILNARYGGVLPPPTSYEPGAAQGLAQVVVSNLGDVALALLPVLLMFIPFKIFFVKMPTRELLRIIIGIIPVYAGLLIFLSGIDYGFALAGEHIGEAFVDPSRAEWFRWILLLIGFILGAAITLSEPAVTVLGEQLEEITNGHIKKLTIRLTLALGIGAAAMLSITQTLIQADIMWFLAPLYAVALVMMKFSPKMFVALAFDSGGVTGGALTSAFLTPLTLGIAQAVNTDGQGVSLLVNGFGTISFISVTPIIAVQALGIIYDARLRKAQALAAAQEAEELGELLGDVQAAAEAVNAEEETT